MRTGFWTLLLPLLLLGLYHTSFSQEYSIINNDSLLLYYLNHPKLDVDTDADVIILQNIETLHINTGSISGNTQNWISATIETCYKLNTTSALALGQITIPYDKGLNDNQFQIIVLTNDGDKLVKNKLKKSDLLVEKIVNKIKVYKLNIPNLHPNSILYLKYNQQRDVSFFFRGTAQRYDWNIESTYPTVETIFEIQIPKELTVTLEPQNVIFDTVSSSGTLISTPNAYFHFEKNLQDDEYSYSKHILKCNNIKPIIEEEENVVHTWYYDKKVVISFLASYFKDMTKNSWKEATQLGSFAALSPEIVDNSFLDKNIVDSLLPSIKNIKDSLSIAKRIYSFVRDSIKNARSDYYQYFLSKSNYNELLKNKQAYTLNKNKLLTCLLRKNGFAACNVLLSTNDILTKNKFEIYKVNYLLTAVSINGTPYLLDAGFKYLPFGTILPKCYNGFAWVITNNGVDIELNAASIEDKNIISCSLTPNKTSDNFDLQIDQRFGKYSGAIYRADLKRDSSELNDEIENNKRILLKDNLIFKDYKIVNKDSIDEPLKIIYSLEYSVEKAGNFVYINPFFSKVASVNPFKNVKRHYPIEYSMPPNKKYLLKMKVPDGYAIEENLEDKKISFQNDLFAYSQSAVYDYVSKTISITYNFIAKTNIVPVVDYGEFRSFYEQIITEQNKKIVLKKE